MAIDNKPVSSEQTSPTRPLLIYCFDALCGWCFGFSPVITALEKTFANRVDFDVLCGGMIPKDNAQPIEELAAYVSQAYKNVEALSGVTFGEDYLWHMFNPDKSDWLLHSETAAIAFAVLKEAHPGRAVELAAAFQHAHMVQGRDLTDGEAYRHLLPVFGMDAETFYTRLGSAEYREKAQYDFALVKQLQVTGYPTLLLQVSPAKFVLLARGYTPLETVGERLEQSLQSLS
jgi:putative protein-disulfide isomerase